MELVELPPHLFEVKGEPVIKSDASGDLIEKYFLLLTDVPAARMEGLSPNPLDAKFALAAAFANAAASRALCRTDHQRSPSSRRRCATTVRLNEDSSFTCEFSTSLVGEHRIEIIIGEELKIAVNLALKNFRENSEETELTLPSSLLSTERAYVHKLAIEMGGQSTSRGKGQTREYRQHNAEGENVNKPQNK